MQSIAAMMTLSCLLLSGAGSSSLFTAGGNHLLGNTKDWLWEHKGKCTSTLPRFLQDEMRVEQDRILDLDAAE
jgi:hypothetical protein